MAVKSSRGSSATSAKPRKASGLVTGKEGRNRIETEQKKSVHKAAQRKAQYNMPKRYWMPPGSEREVIVLDVEPWAFRYEHALDNPETQRKDLYVACIQETDDCPGCHTEGREGAWVMYLTVIDTESFTLKRGKNAGKVVPYTQKLFVVKSRQQSKFKRKFDAITNSKGLRGLRVKLFRDDDRSPVIGNDIEFTGKRVSEAGLAKFVEEYVDKNGKNVRKELNQALDYEALFPSVTKEELAAQCGHRGTTPGSAQEAEQEQAADAGAWDKSPDEVPWEETKKKPATRKKVTRKKGAGLGRRGRA